MAPFTAIVADDEAAAHFVMLDLIKVHQQTIQLVAQSYSGKETIDLIHSLRPEIVFLDIQMNDMNAFEVLAHLSYHPYIIFCTAYDQYALDAFKENTIDYLLKPVDEDRFAQCIGKIQRMVPSNPMIAVARLLELENKWKTKKKATAIPVTIKSKIILVRCSEITFCFAGDGYVGLHTDDGKEYISNLTLNELEERLPDNFMRVQKSYIVNKDKINEIHKYFNNRLILVMDDNKSSRITTGTSYIKGIREELDL